MAAFSISYHLTQTLCILFSFPFNPNPAQSYGQAHFGNGFSLNCTTSHGKLGATFVTSLKTVAVGPEVAAKGRSSPAQRSELRQLMWGQGGWDQPEGQTVWNTVFSVSSGNETPPR